MRKRRPFKKMSPETKRKLMESKRKVPDYVVTAIRFCHDCGMRNKELSALLKLSLNQVSGIVTGRLYSY